MNTSDKLSSRNQTWTPGPWSVEDPLGPEILSIVAGGPNAYDWLHVAQLGVDREPDELSEQVAIPEAQVKANAQLIAAAPTLYAALLRLDAFWTKDHPAGPEYPERMVGRLSDECVEIWRQIRSALAAAHRQSTAQVSGVR